MANSLTEVRLLAVPLERDYKHTLYFSDRATQTSYFQSKTVKSMVNCTYQRKENIIRYDGVYDDIIGCNYVMYRNTGYSTKWYYAFITKIEFVSEGTSKIYIETDVMQTWMMDEDYFVKSSFVEREHVKDDTIGLHTVPENLETGEYIVNSMNINRSLTLNSKVIIGTTVDFNDPDFKLFNVYEVKEFNNTSGGVYNGVFSGVKYFSVTPSEAFDLLKTLANTGQSDAIVSIFMAPENYLSTTKPDGKTYYELNNILSAVSKEWVTDETTRDVENLKPTHLDDYEPKNNKLFTYPYCYMLMDNNSGGSAVYQYELFSDPENSRRCPFKIVSAVTPGMSIRLIPQYYKGVVSDTLGIITDGANDIEGLNLGKFPVCSWSNDVYTNWLTQNSVNIGLSVAGGITSALIGVGAVVAAPVTAGASLGLAGAVGVAGSVAGGIGAIANAVGSVHQQSFQPPQAQGNTNAGDVTFANSRTTFTAYQMTIKEEYARIIDDYFQVFGYKVSRVKTPNKNHRKNYWYTKTIDVNIDGNIPVDDMEKIKACFNNGITFWKNPENIGIYNDNAIV